MKTIIKTILNFPNYAISENGDIWSNKFYKFLKPGIPSCGYPQVVLYKKGKKYNKSIHRLILETFVGSCPKGMECRHLDGNKQNNYLSNLRWSTRKENQQDRIRHGTDNNGEKSGLSKLTKQKVKLIRKLYKSKKLNQCQLADKFNIHQTNISLIINKRIWKHI